MRSLPKKNINKVQNGHKFFYFFVCRSCFVTQKQEFAQVVHDQFSVESIFDLKLAAYFRKLLEALFRSDTGEAGSERHGM